MFPSARKLANFLVFPGFCVRCIGRRSESPGGTLTVAVINMFRVLGQAADGLDAVQKARGGTSAVAAINLR